MTRLLPTRRCAVAALLGLVVAGVSAAPVPRADARAVRAVIEAQLAAFAADNAEAAFGHAAPAIRNMFGSAERFMTMVRDGYPVVYRPASVAFLVPSRDAGKPDVVLQQVQMTDAAGAPWLVAYEVERQPDKTWRISACVAVRAPGRAT